MTITCHPFDAIPLPQEDFAEMFTSFLKDGYIRDYLDELVVSQSDPTGMKVSLSTGRARLQAYWYENLADVDLTLDAADPSNPRIDRVVIRLEAAAPRQVSARILKGTAAPSPSAPSLATGDGGIYEISAARIAVAAGVSSIVSADITDERNDLSACGIASSAKIKYTEIGITGALDLDTHKVTNLADPTADGDAVTKGYFDDNVGASFGTTKCDILAYRGASVPAGWLECNGASLLRASYPNLFSAFGTTFGSADGTHFNLPDLKGKMIYGAATSLGTTGGEKTHELTETEMAAHTHTPVTLQTGTPLNQGSSGGPIISVASGNSSSTGSGTAHNNLHPYMALRFIVRAS